MPSLELESMGGSYVVCMCKILPHNHPWPSNSYLCINQLYMASGHIQISIVLSIYLCILVSANKDIPTLLMVSKTVSEAPAAVKRLSRLGPA